MQRKAFPYEIKKGTIKTAVELSRKIPEFSDPHGIEVYEQRLKNTSNLILVVYDDDVPIGFKVGYEREGDFYSWMGGVLPDYRNKGIAQRLADVQEAWAKQHNYPHVTFKTRNRHRAMLLFAIKNGFEIIGFEKRTNTAENRILLRKFL
jgi:ribosomal protein S18 acetylase RimI-like enzyme